MEIVTNRTLLPVAASLAIGLLSLPATAATISTSVVVPAISGSGYTPPMPVAGLAQFDPSNGTLTGIEFGLDISSYDLAVSLGSWDDPGTGALFQSADLQAQMSVNVELSGGGGLLFASTVFSDTIFNEFDSISAVGVPGLPRSSDATAQLTSHNLFSSFIGTGNVSILGLGVFSFGYPGMVALDDGTFADGQPSLDSFNVGPSTMSITYTYTPAVVPLPASVWLLGSALLGLAGIRRKIG